MQPNILRPQQEVLGSKLFLKLKYKKYFRKSSLKQKGIGDSFLKEILSTNPKTFLEVGVFHGVTARNVCELLYQSHKENFRYIGVDLFEVSEENQNETIPSTIFSNPLKRIYFKYILRRDPYTFDSVYRLLKKFKNNIQLIKGNSNTVLKQIEMSEIEYVFLDGGHHYDTVKNDLNNCQKVLENKTNILR